MRTTPGGDCAPIVTCTDDDADCETKCKAGDPKSCNVLATHLMAKKDYPRAHHVAHTGCALGNPESCEIAGTSAILRSDVSEADKHRSAFKNFSKACPAIPRACERAAMHFLAGPDKDPDKAQPLLEQACAGNPSSCMALADYHLRFKSDAAKATEAADKACSGSPEHSGYYCARFGEYLEFGGSGLTKDPAKALGYFEKGCDKGDSEACVDLGFAHREGIGTKKDPAKARDAFTKGCKKGGSDNKWHGWSCVWAGTAFEDGVGGAKDPAKAFEYYSEACDSGMGGSACYRQAAMLEKGAKGVTKDTAKANELYTKACEKIFTGSDADRQLSREACDKTSADWEKKDKQKATDFWSQRCEKRGDVHACVKWKALGGTPAPELLTKRMNAAERECKHGGLEGCKNWKDLGGKPTAADMKATVTPWGHYPPSEGDEMAKPVPPGGPAAPPTGAAPATSAVPGKVAPPKN
jgi:TPR repeat protein